MAKIKIPTSGAVIGQQGSVTPQEYPGTGQFVGAALTQLSEMFAQFHQKEAIRADKNMLAANPIEDVIKSSVTENLDGIEYNPDGSIDYANSIEKTGNVIDSLDALWESSRAQTLANVQNMPFKTREAQEAAIAAVQGFYSKGDSTERRQALIAQQDGLKKDWVEDLVEEAKYDPSVDISDLVIKTASIVETMADKSEAQKYLSINLESLLAKKSQTIEGATQILLGSSDNEQLNNLMAPYKPYALRTFSKNLNLDLSNKDMDSNNQSFNPINGEVLDLLESTVIGMDNDDPFKVNVLYLIDSAKSRERYNQSVIEEWEAISNGRETSITDVDRLDRYLHHLGFYRNLGDETLALFEITKIFNQSSTQLPEHLLNEIDRFILKQDFKDPYEERTFRELAVLYDQYELQGLSKEAQGRIEYYNQQPGSMEFAERLARSRAIQEYEMTDEDQVALSKALLPPEEVKSYWDTNIEDILEDIQIEGIDPDEINQVQLDAIRREANRYIKQEFIIQASKGGMISPDINDLRKKGLQAFFRNNTLVPYKGLTGDTEIPIFITIPKTFEGKTVQDDQVIDYFQSILMDALKTPDLQGEDLKAEVDKVLPNIEVRESIQGSNRYSMYREDGTLIDTTGTGVTFHLEQLFEHVYMPTNVIQAREIDPGDPQSIIENVDPVTPRQKESYDDWKTLAPSPENVQEFPFSNQWKEVMNDEDFKALSPEDQSVILRELGAKQIADSKADPYLRSPQFVKFFADEYRALVEREADHLVSQLKSEQFTEFPPKRFGVPAPDLANAKKEFIEDADRELANLDPKMSLFTRYTSEDFPPDPIEGWAAMPAEIGMVVESAVTGLRKAPRRVQVAYQNALQQYQNMITNLNEEDRRDLLKENLGGRKVMMDAAVKHVTPIGVLQGRRGLTDISDNKIMQGIIRKLERRKEINDDTSLSILAYTVPNNALVYIELDSLSNKQMVSQMPKISETIKSDLLESQSGMFPKGVTRLATLSLVDGDKRMTQLLGAMSDTRFDKFIDLYLKRSPVNATD